MKLINQTPFSTDSFEQYDNEGKMHTVIAVRGTFILLLENGKAKLQEAEKQDPFMWEDEYETTSNGLMLVKQCDFIPFKPATDVTLNASCWFNDENETRTIVEFTVNDVTKHLNVFGPRYWQKNSMQEWSISKPTSAKSTPIRWDLSFGGRFINGKTESDVNIYNPIGIGFLDFSNKDIENIYAAPQIIYADDFEDAPKRPAGFGPISPSWESRLKFGGTYDKKWKETRHPLLPKDFDNRFWNCAPDDQQFTPWLKGGEVIRLKNLHPVAYVLSFQLPRLTLLCRVKGVFEEPTFFELVLDGVHIDMDRDVYPYINICWRVSFPYAQGIREICLLNGVSVDDALSNLEEDHVE